MIRQVDKDDLPACLEVIHRGYETVAVEFGLTEQNCPDRGRASLPIEKLAEAFNGGDLMYVYEVDDKMVGYLGMKVFGDVCGLDDIVVLPDHRHNGYGQDLLDFCKDKTRQLGATRLRLGMIDDNKRLRHWYEQNGFVNVSYVNYQGAPFSVGKMECNLCSS